MSREQDSRRTGKRPVTRIRAHGPKESEVRVSRPGRSILGIEHSGPVRSGGRTSDSDEVSESKGG
jgi:hypothetical protein